jgi:hypothetical protein
MVPPARMRRAPGTTGRNNPTKPPSTRTHPKAKRALRRMVTCTFAAPVSCITDLLKRSTNRFLAVASTFNSENRIEGDRWLSLRDGIQGFKFSYVRFVSVVQNNHIEMQQASDFDHPTSTRLFHI